MVITLVRLWSRLSPDASERENLMLDNFLHLVIATDYATRRNMSISQAEFFDSHMYDYLVTLREVFGIKFVTNHHMALHLHEFLKRFGPVHAWWSFPFERYNGLIAKLNSNHRTSTQLAIVPSC